ncbi:group II intron reverse transcriptase/maturase [Pleurocapsa sp. FMAR1]|uniref:group II intron reverse transcriptase/maturase n=1 Tax=Pleurocapsa sp. FMAR1 TaxID=3040204 RepID=UPI0029C8CECA|nr:group II intron reverse transcriptase/maturase [Pleurocapsa sp. FMAR1]
MTNSNSLKNIEVWEKIDWLKVERYVYKLQKQIFKASSHGDKKKVRQLQKTLIRFWYNRLLAVRRVSQDNRGKKTAGVDGIKSLTPVARIRLAKQLIIRGTSKATLRVWIPKPGKDEKRPLGIPTMHDRALQGVVKNAIEPEWEAIFEPNSYGFRPGRACHDAITLIRFSIEKKPKYVLDADISKCFDKIDHAALLKKIGYKGKVRQQVKAWLESGVIDNKTFLETEEGTPQGGVISPLLANIALHGLEEHLNEFAKTIDMKKPDGRHQQGWQDKVKSLNFIRYADDFVLMHKDKKVILEGKAIVEKWLSKIGLELKPSKTRIAHTLLPEESEDGKAGFNFLGFHIRTFKVGYHSSIRLSTGKRPGIRTLITPTKEAYKKHQEKLRETIKNKKIEGQAELIGKLNPIIRGWMNYYKTSDISTVGGHSNQDSDLYHKLRSWSRRRCKANWKRAYTKYWNHVSIRGKIVSRFSTKGVKGGLYLTKHTDTPCSTKYVKVKGKASPYDGNLIYWATRMGRHPEMDSLKASLLKKQKGKCARCGLYIRNGDIQETDHIIAKKLNGKNVYSNYQLLHGHCHDEKTASDIKLINAAKKPVKDK